MLRAAGNTEDTNPYLAARFVRARAEEGHAEIALEDLANGNQRGGYVEYPVALEYDEFLQREADKFPLAILGHSYLFENASGSCSPARKAALPFQVHRGSRERRPEHSIAIKKTVEEDRARAQRDQKEEVVRFARESGEFLLTVFGSIGS